MIWMIIITFWISLIGFLLLKLGIMWCRWWRPWWTRGMILRRLRSGCWSHLISTWSGTPEEDPAGPDCGGAHDDRRDWSKLDCSHHWELPRLFECPNHVLVLTRCPNSLCRHTGELDCGPNLLRLWRLLSSCATEFSRLFSGWERIVLYGAEAKFWFKYSTDSKFYVDEIPQFLLILYDSILRWLVFTVITYRDC